MKKITCPSCGKVNYEAFATFPHCADCGTLLPETEEPTASKFWQRQVGTLWWISLLGVAAIIATFFVTRLSDSRVESDQLLAYGAMQRNLVVGKSASMRLTLDTVAATGMLRDVELRFSQDTLRRWTLVSLQPKPKRIYQRGSGVYYSLGDLPTGSTLYFVWKAQQAGEQRLSISIFADEHSSMRYAPTMHVRPASP